MNRACAVASTRKDEGLVSGRRFVFDLDAAKRRALQRRAVVIQGDADVQVTPARSSCVSLASSASSIGPLNGLSEDERCRYEERAAVLQYDGCLSRREAERVALQEILTGRQ